MIGIPLYLFNCTCGREPYKTISFKQIDGYITNGCSRCKNGSVGI